MSEEYTDLDYKEQAILKLPVYFGSRDNNHHAIREGAVNARDILLDNPNGKIVVTLHPDRRTVTIKDNGCGIVLDGESKGKPNWQHAFLILFSGSKMSTGGTSGGTNGCGNTIINYTSDLMEITSKRNGHIYHIKFKNGGEIDEPFACLGDTTETGTEITFKLNDKIYTNAIFEVDIVRNIVEQIVATTPNITSTFIYNDEATNFNFESLSSYLTYKNLKREVEDIVLEEKSYETEFYNLEKDSNDTETTTVSMVINSNNTNQLYYPYLNGIYLPILDKNTIHIGVLDGMKDVLHKYIMAHDMYNKSEKSITRSDVAETISYICSVDSTNVSYEGQTKFLTKKAVYEQIIKQFIKEFMEVYVLEHEDNMDKLAKRVLISKHSRERAEEAKKGKTKTSDSNKLPVSSKLMNWTTLPAEVCEIYIVEGDSAGGSAKQGAKKSFQAVLPTRGKILNVDKATLDRILNSETLQIFNKAINVDPDKPIEMSKLNFHKIIIMSDADVDGYHIRVLWLTYIFRHMKALIEEGKVYMAQPPLYKVTKRSKGKTEIFKYAYNDEELETITAEYGGSSNVDVQRYKGLGEMNATQLWDTTMNPETRSLLQVTMKDAEKANELFTILMGEEVPPRKEFIIENSNNVIDLDI